MTDNGTGTDDNCVQFVFFKLDASWRRQPADTRTRHKEEFLTTLRATKDEVPAHAFSTLGLRADTDFMLWRTSTGLDCLEATLGALLSTE
ncbi:MAG: chlorite dismutase family protein, partial [Chloroflexi bacterium]|nr:chlorite dismutase family protein [Chloroflexota bacterium]